MSQVGWTNPKTNLKFWLKNTSNSKKKSESWPKHWKEELKIDACFSAGFLHVKTLNKVFIYFSGLKKELNVEYFKRRIFKIYPD